MAETYNERCIKCRWLAPDLSPPCGRVFKVAYLVGPFGGDIVVEFVPGMVPKEFEERLKLHIGKACEWLAAVIQADGIWPEIGEFQKANPSKVDCPGRDETENPFLRVVK